MRPVTVRLTAVGFSPWIILDRYSKSFTVGLGAKCSSNFSGAYNVEHTFDNVADIGDLVAFNPASNLARSGTTATYTKTNHGLSVGDYIGPRGAGAPFDGDYAVAAVTDQNNVTFTVANTGPTVAQQGARVLTARVFVDSGMSAKTGSAESNYSSPPVACRLNLTSLVAGYMDLTVTQGGR